MWWSGGILLLARVIFKTLDIAVNWEALGCTSLGLFTDLEGNRRIFVPEKEDLFIRDPAFLEAFQDSHFRVVTSHVIVAR